MYLSTKYKWGNYSTLKLGDETTTNEAKILYKSFVKSKYQTEKTDMIFISNNWEEEMLLQIQHVNPTHRERK